VKVPEFKIMSVLLYFKLNIRSENAIIYLDVWNSFRDFEV